MCFITPRCSLRARTGEATRNHRPTDRPNRPTSNHTNRGTSTGGYNLPRRLRRCSNCCRAAEAKRRPQRPTPQNAEHTRKGRGTQPREGGAGRPKRTSSTSKDKKNKHAGFGQRNGTQHSPSKNKKVTNATNRPSYAGEGRNVKQQKKNCDRDTDDGWGSRRADRPKGAASCEHHHTDMQQKDTAARTDKEPNRKNESLRALKKIDHIMSLPSLTV